MKDIVEYDLKTPAEWSRIAGIELNDYNGFLDAYEKLIDKKRSDFIVPEYMMIRTKVIPQYIMCSRQAFDKALIGCSCIYPRQMDYDQLSEVAPNFCERLINDHLYGSMILLEEIQKKGDVPSDSLYTKEEFIIRLLKILESYEKAIENNTSLNNIKEERLLEDLLNDPFDSILRKNRIISSAMKKGGTVEELEKKLLKKSIKSVNDVFSGKKDISTISINHIKALARLRRVSSRALAERKVEIEKGCFKNPNYNKDGNETVVSTYRVFDQNGMHNVVAGMNDGVVLSLETDENLYEHVKEKERKAKTSMRAVVVESVDDCTKSDMDEAKRVEDEQLTEEQGKLYLNPGDGGE